MTPPFVRRCAAPIHLALAVSALAACSAASDAPSASNEASSTEGAALQRVGGPVGLPPIHIQPLPPAPPPPPPPPPPAPVVIGDANDPDTIRTDADAFLTRYFGGTDLDEVNALLPGFQHTVAPPYWSIGRRTSALVQMYDLLAPIDPARAAVYLARLRAIAGFLLTERDDLTYPPTIDAFRNRAMPAWGAFTADRDGKWNTDVVTAGLFTYAMSAFAKRVLTTPSLQTTPGYVADAIRFTTATLETYEAYRPEMHLVEGDSEGYYTVPAAYAGLQCNDDTTAHACEGYRDTAGQSLAFNENLSLMKAMAEAALAADTPLYRASPDATGWRLYMATQEAPLLIAKNFAFFDHHLSPQTLSDGTPYFVWNHQVPNAHVQDTAHASFELGSLATLLDDKYDLDVILTRNGRAEQVGLSTPLFVRFANTLLREVWQYDYSNPSGLRNLLRMKVDGSGDLSETTNASVECAGWIPLAQFSPWVWNRCRDVTLHGGNNAYLREDNHAALLRYRQFNVH